MIGISNGAVHLIKILKRLEVITFGEARDGMRGYICGLINCLVIFLSEY